MFIKKKKLTFIVVLILLYLMVVSPAASTKSKKEESVTLKEKSKIYLERSNNLLLKLESPINVQKIKTDGKWAKIQLTAWVLKSNLQRQTGEKASPKVTEEEKKPEKMKPTITGTAGPFKITVKNIHFVDKVKDRFGTEYESGPEGRFLVLNLKAKNSHEKKDMNLYKTDIVLIDANGRQYKSVGISNEESFQGGTIGSKKKRQGYLFFSVFNDSNLDKIKIAGNPCTSCKKYKKTFTIEKADNKSTES